MNAVNWDQRLTQIDELVKNGKKSEVLSIISELMQNDPPINIKPKIARLANRAGFPQLGLKILYKDVRDSKIGVKDIPSETISVYAQSLLNIGALQESEVLLNSITDRPEYELQKAFICFAKWDYQKAIPHLKKYLKQNELSRYQTFVGQVNYIAALVSTAQFKHALLELQKLEVQLIEDKAHLLLGNLYELKAQVLIFKRNYSQALEAIEKSWNYLKAFPGRYSLYTRKWTAVINFHENHDAEKLILDLRQIASEALTIRDWETTRDCEFHIALLLKSKPELDQIYLGSPYAGFRMRLRNLYGLKVPKNFNQIFYIGQFNNNSAEVALDFDDSDQVTQFSASEQKVLQVMLRDLFRPPRIGELFFGLYPNDYFDPFSSPQRVKNVIHRLNKTLLAMKSDIKIKTIKGHYVFESAGSKCIHFNHKQLFWAYEKFLLKYIHNKVKSSSFSFSEIKSELLNSYLFKNLMLWGLKNNKILKINGTRPVRYRFAQVNKV